MIGTEDTYFLLTVLSFTLKALTNAETQKNILTQRHRGRGVVVSVIIVVPSSL